MDTVVMDTVRPSSVRPEKKSSPTMFVGVPILLLLLAVRDRVCHAAPLLYGDQRPLTTDFQFAFDVEIQAEFTESPPLEGKTLAPGARHVAVISFTDILKTAFTKGPAGNDLPPALAQMRRHKDTNSENTFNHLKRRVGFNNESPEKEEEEGTQHTQDSTMTTK